MSWIIAILSILAVLYVGFAIEIYILLIGLFGAFGQKHPFLSILGAIFWPILVTIRIILFFARG